MDSDSDDYDYLSCLTSGFNTDRCLKKSSIETVVSVDTNSDTYDSDSDECVIIECFNRKNGKTQDQNKDNLTPTKQLIEEQNKLILEESPSISDDQKSRNIDNIGLRLDSFVQNIKCLKDELETKPKTCVKEESVDVKPDLKAPDFDIKPFVLKIENDVKKEESLQSKPTESKDNESDSLESTLSNVESIRSTDFGSENSFETSETSGKGSKHSNDCFCALLSIIEKIRSERQKPTFDRILIKYKKIVDETDPKSSLKFVISDAIENNLVEKIGAIDEKDVSFRTVTTQTQKSRKTFKRTPFSSKESDFRKEKGWEEMNANSDNTVESSRNFESIPSKLESLALEGYTHINDIDVFSAPTLFGDTELDPEIFELYQVPIETSPTSLSFSSTPIKSFNHNMNKEVIRKQLTPTSSTTNEDIDAMLSLKDYRNWLLEPLPRFSPFIAQTGDRVVYLRDAHQIYIDYELRELRELYPKFHSTPEEINAAINSEDYVINAIICDVKFYQINCIKFSLIQLKSQSNENPFQINVLYRPNRGICDFLVLEYIYKESQIIDWQSGHEFRSLWKKSWWMGTVLSKTIFDLKYPNSLFKCYKVMWHTGERGRLSPWDLFNTDPNRMPRRKENGVLITREDLLKINYKPHFNEWPEVYGLEMDKWRCHESKRIYNAIKFIEKNVFPHILSVFREYHNSKISYPVNLQLIKERLKNLFYRRKETIIRDITYLKTNAKLYVKKSDFKNCEDFVDMLLGVANDCQSIRVEHFDVFINKYSHLKDNIPELVPECPPKCSQTSYSEHSFLPNTSTTFSSSMPKTINQIQTKDKKISRKRSAPDSSHLPLNSDVKVTESMQWKVDSQKFIDILLKNDDSLPYRQPVDDEQYPFYRKVIAEPIDLSGIQNKLSLDQYPNPIQLRKDFRLMFENAKVFSKDPRSKMRIINKNLFHFAEDKLREIIVDWERIYSYEQKRLKTSGFKVRKPISRNQLWGYGYQQYY